MKNRIYGILPILAFVMIAFLAALVIKGPNCLNNACQNQISAIKQFNNKTANTLQELAKTKFFRIIRLNLNEICPIQYGAKICKSKSCTVCRCDEKDIPQNWVKTDKVKRVNKGKDMWSKERETQQLDKWVWDVEDQENDAGQYFDVQSNVESFSGSNGSYVWRLIYEENCFKGASHLDEMCLEEQVLYKIISGLHTSISSDISKLYKNVTQAAVWADKGDESFTFNHKFYNERIVQHPQRVKNMIFLYQLLVRSVQKLITYVETQPVISSDNITEDMKATKLLNEFIKETKNIKFKPLNETDASFFVESNPLVRQYQKYIHNISKILSCVECQKCRLFGKMQIYGIGTALKILLNQNNGHKRNQIVALFNALNKLSVSVNTFFNHEQFLNEGMYADQYRPINYTIIGLPNNQQSKSLCYAQIVTAFGLLIVIFYFIMAKTKNSNDNKGNKLECSSPRNKPRRE